MAREQLNPCSICGRCEAGDFARFFNGPITLWRCRGCGYVSPAIGPGNWQPPEELAGEGTEAFVASGEAWRYPHRARVLGDIARRIVGRVGAGSRVLDVGCGDGQFLSLAREAGLDAVGIEGDEALTLHAAARSGCDVRGGRDALEILADLPAEGFDVVTFIHSLEHFSNPLDLLLAARRVLQPGGWLVIDLPSIRSPHWLAWRVTGLARFIDNAWGVIDEHAGYYTPRVLGRLTQRAGFRTRQLTTGRWRYKYGGLARVAAVLLDPLLNMLRVGGIFYVGQRPR